jgi:hypothetical protein
MTGINAQEEAIGGKVTSIDCVSFDRHLDRDEDNVVKGIIGGPGVKIGFIVETADAARVYCETLKAEWFDGNDLQVGAEVYLSGHFETDAGSGDPTFVATRGAVRT